MDVNECVEWAGRRHGAGYGMDGQALAHRVAWEREHGEIPEGMVIHHVCENKLCVNVEHLRCITHAEHNALHVNAAAWHERQRAKTHCPHGHEYTVENTIVKRGRRHCRACENQRSREYHARNRESILPKMRAKARERYWAQKEAA